MTGDRESAAASPGARMLVRDLVQVASPAGRSAPLRGDALGAVDVVEDAFILCEGGRIIEVGRMRELGRVDGIGGELIEIDGSGKSALPGLVDCHTHACFGGDRVEEYALQGARSEL